jgi:hypothetical protein
MSTLVEIQDAVARLPNSERKALQLWLNSQSEPELTALEEQRLLRSLDEAVRDIDADAKAGRLDKMIAKAKAGYRAGNATPFP